MRKVKRALIEAEMASQPEDRLFLLSTEAVLRGVVVTDTVPTPAAVAGGYDDGFTEQLVACAGTAQDTLTVEENPKNGVTPRSLIYDAVCPATTVWDVIPRFATVKSATRFNAIAADVEAV